MRRTNYEEVKAYFESKGYTLISTEFRGAKYLLETECPEGHPYPVNYSNFKHNNRRCPKCVGGVRLSIEEVKKAFEKRGYTLLEDSYQNNVTPMRCLCDKGHPTEITYASIKRGRGCNVCARNQPLTIDEVKAHVEEFGYTLHSNAYARNTDKIVVQCKFKHKKYPVSVMKFRAGRRCPYCQASKGERTVNYLLANMLPEGVEYTFQQPKTISDRNLRFDFYVNVGPGVYIEYQGEEHDEAVDHFGGEETFLDLQYRDSLKRDNVNKEGSELCYVGYQDSNRDIYHKMIVSLSKHVTLKAISDDNIRRAHLYDIDRGFDLHNLLDFYISHTAKETATKFNINEATVYRYFKDFYGETKRTYLKNGK